MAQSPRRTLPTGTVTFLFSDIEGSTRLVAALEPVLYRNLLERHHAMLRAAFGMHGGAERGTQGDAFLVVFEDAPAAVAAAVEAQRALAAAMWPSGATVRVRMGLHTGQGIAGGDDYVGLDINRAARIAAAAHGGQVLVSDATRALVERSLPDGVSLLDLGQHRLKDLTRDERIFQLVVDGLPATFPPLRSVPTVEGNLPVRLTSFIGRSRELDELSAILDDARLVTLTGPGGTGKSSLAIALAERLAERYPDGAWFVPLDSVLDGELVPAAIASTIGLVADPASARDRLLGHLADRSLLLVLDNVEQVRSVAPFLQDLLRAAPGVRLVVTSRAPLQLTSEQEYPVQPLPLPDPASDPIAAAGADCVRLFVDRARRVQLGFSVTAENVAAVTGICTRLDGLPLGIELAAGRIGLLTPAAIADRIGRQLDVPGSALRDLPERQRTLHSTIAWSYDLLDEPRRRLFSRLAVFAGGCRLEEAETVCGPAGDLGIDVLEGMSGLVEESLVQTSLGPDGPRFGLLGTIRFFATERLAETGETDTIRRRHALAYLTLAEASNVHLPGRDQVAWLARLNSEVDNLRSATQWTIETQDAEMGLRLLAAQWRFWQLAGHIEDGLAMTSEVLAIPGTEQVTTWRLKAIEAAGGLHYWHGDGIRAHELYTEQLELATTIGDRRSIADALYNLSFPTGIGDLEAGLGPEAATEMAVRAAQIFAELGDRGGEARTAWAIGSLQQFQGSNSEAIAVFEVALERFRELDDITYVTLTLGSLGWAYMALGDVDAALSFGTRSLAGYHALGDVSTTTLTLHGVAIVLAQLGRWDDGAVIEGAFVALADRYGVQPPISLERLLYGADGERAAGTGVREIVAALRGPAFDAARTRGAPMSLDEAVEFVARIGQELGST